MVSFWKRPMAVNVTPQPDYQILVTFEGGEERTFDIKPYLTTKPYDELKDLGLFNKVQISGMKVEWRPRLDFDINDLCQDD